MPYGEPRRGESGDRPSAADFARMGEDLSPADIAVPGERIYAAMPTRARCLWLSDTFVTCDRVSTPQFRCPPSSIDSSPGYVRLHVGHETCNYRSLPIL